MLPSSRRGYNAGYQLLADINVTPLVDVMLVLLIIFMITAPMLTAGIKIDLPQAKAAKPLNPKEPVIVNVAKDGKLSFGPGEITKDELIEAIEAKIGDDPAHVIYVRGDKDASYGDIMGVIDLLASNGLVHVALISDSRNKVNKIKAEAQPAPPDAYYGQSEPDTKEPRP